MPHWMANAARMWKEADKAKCEEFAENTARSKIENLDDAERKAYILIQLKLIQSSERVHILTYLTRMFLRLGFYLGLLLVT
jgi:hypothetical protein